MRSKRRGHGPSLLLALGGHHPARPPLPSSLPTSSWLGVTAAGPGARGQRATAARGGSCGTARPQRSLAGFAFSTVSYRHFLPFQQKPVSSKPLFLPSYHIHLYHLSLAFKYHGDSELKTRTGNCFDIVTSSWDEAGISHLGACSARWTKPLPPPSISDDFMAPATCLHPRSRRAAPRAACPWPPAPAPPEPRAPREQGAARAAPGT